MKKARDFKFKKFTVAHDESTHKVGTDGVLLGAWVNLAHAKSVLDIGTGSGVIALMLAQRTEAPVRINAVELQETDARQALKNIEASQWRERITLHHCAIQDFNPDSRFDLIVTNPPFFINSWLPPTESRTAVRHTTTLSFEDLLSSAIRMMNREHGRLAIILPHVEGRQFLAMAQTKGLHCIRECEFRSRQHKPVERLLLEFSFQNLYPVKEELVLYKEADGEEWSDSYKALTGDFYLKI
jgi:tRNA1Val (adenine37-N6)-methyltransferase